MDPRTPMPLVLVLVFLFLFVPAGLLADQTSVRLEVPGRVDPGTDVTVRVLVAHEGNNFFHFTDWVVLAANGKEIARWDFTAESRPEAEHFTRETTTTVTGPTTFRARGNCNLHGSAGEAEAVVRVGAAVAPEAAAAPVGDLLPLPAQGRRGLGLVVLILGIVNLILLLFQVASGRRWIKVKIIVHRRSGQALAVLALIHGILAFLVSG